MRPSFRFLVIAIFAISVLLSWQEALAWGGRGHDTICQAATYLVENPELKNYLTHRPHVMGYLCNIPDTHWRNFQGSISTEGGPTHYIDLDVLPVPGKDVPLDLSKIITDYTNKKRPNRDAEFKSVPHEMGTIWWRVEQFFKLAIADKEKLKAAPATPGKPESSENSDWNNAVYNMTLNMGFMGHYVGDSAQPFHTTEDYDGYAKGHGGIHSYYEELAVAALPGDLQSRIIQEAKKLKSAARKQSFLSAPTTLEKMREITLLSFVDMEKVLKADLLTKPSEMKEEKGMKMKKPAEREPLEKTLKKFEPLIIIHMGRAVALLSVLWDDIYLQAGSPNLSMYRAYKFPHSPDFVMPDYYEIKK